MTNSLPNNLVACSLAFLRFQIARFYCNLKFLADVSDIFFFLLGGGKGGVRGAGRGGWNFSLKTPGGGVSPAGGGGGERRGREGVCGDFGSRNRKRCRQTGSRQSTPLSTIRTRYGNSVSAPEPHGLAKTSRILSKREADTEFEFSVSTPHRRYGHRLRTPFLRTPFPRLLLRGGGGLNIFLGQPVCRTKLPRKVLISKRKMVRKTTRNFPEFF